ncbi:helix-turn-helix transcriptional regulator [Mycoplana ramosa]|uniref:LuxR C-terminal-related transcriptional regulator n=1 Tax=Mycoplana ramosa TaxID=40837 RepID=A0ABW3YX53_MYCRA
MAALSQHHRRYDLEGDLEKALNRVDFFRLFHGTALRFGFEHFGVLQLSAEQENCNLSSKLVLHDLPSGLAETYDQRHRFSDSDVFRSLHSSVISTVWRAKVSGPEGVQNDLLGQLGFDQAVCVPVHAPTGARYAVLYLGDSEDIGRQQHMQLCYETSCIFDYFYRIVLSTKAGMGLTPRETEILRWISYGKTASEIALIVSVSEHTVNSHTATILKKLDVVNRTQMVAKAIREQIIL